MPKYGHECRRSRLSNSRTFFSIPDLQLPFSVYEATCCLPLSRYVCVVKEKERDDRDTSGLDFSTASLLGCTVVQFLRFANVVKCESTVYSLARRTDNLNETSSSKKDRSL